MTVTPSPENDPGEQRIDKWLWHARFFKTRGLAAKAVAAGSMRLTRGDAAQRVSKASQAVRAGDVLSFMTGSRVRVVCVLGCGVRRGPAKEAQALYEDRSPPPPPKRAPPAAPFSRAPGAGRPTKKDRRALDTLREED